MGNLNVSGRDSATQAKIDEMWQKIDSANTASIKEKLSEIIANNEKDKNPKQKDYVTNTEDNLFLKEYIEGRAEAEGIQIPTGFKIKISNYNDKEYRDIYSGNLLKGSIGGIQSEQYWNDIKTDFFNFIHRKNDSYKPIEEYCKEKGLNEEQTEKVKELYLFHDVRVNIFKARIKDMFTLLSKDKKDVEKRVEQMHISDEQKEEIMQVKNFLDRYYKVEAEYDGKTYNLLNLSQEDLEELNEKSPELAKFLEKIRPEIKKHSATFAQKEMQSEELSDAGQSSQWIAWPLMLALGIGLGKGYFEGKAMKEGIKQSEKFAEFIRKNPQEGQAILDKCVKKFNKLNKNGTIYTKDGELAGTKLIERYMKNIGFEGGEFIVQQKAIQSQGLKKWVNPITKFKNTRGAALTALILGTMSLSMDDCLGAGKDFFQDQNNFGFATGLGFAAAGITGGILSSAAFIPTFQGVVDYLRADKTLSKMGITPNRKMSEKLFTEKTIQKMNKIPIIGGKPVIGLAVGGLMTLLGVTLASTSSGSSWTSMALTRWLLGKNGDELEKKNIIDAKDNTFVATDKNMMEYDAYKGKAKGITYSIPTGDWFIGTTGGVLRAFTHSNPVIQNTFTTLQGCSETLTASGYQILGDHTRNSAIREQKEQLVKSAKENKSV